MSKLLTLQDYAWAGNKLNCEVSNIMAVSKKEAPGAGFIGDRPKILCERHHFSRKTGGIYDKSHPDISNKTPGGYIGGAKEWDRFFAMARLDFEAAIYATSFGKFQVMGFNYKLAGYNSLKEFYEAMFKSEGEHLKAFINYVIARGLDDELRNENYRDFAEGYNGPKYYLNHYDTDIAQFDKEYERQGVDNPQPAPPAKPMWEELGKVPNIPSPPPPPPPPTTPNPASAPAGETVTKEVKTTEWIDLDGVQSKAEKVNTVVETVTKRSDQVKSLWTTVGMKVLGALTMLEGFWDNNHTAVYVGLAIIVLFALLYVLRQWHIGAIQTKKL